MAVKAEDVLYHLAKGQREGAEALLPLAELALREMKAAVNFRVLYRRLYIDLAEDGIEADGVALISRSLKKRMEGCREALFFAATLGAEVDRLIARESLLEMSRAVILEAAANAVLEDELNAWHNEINNGLTECSLALTPRFCPGYGDWSLEDLERVLKLAQAHRIGLALTENSMLVPAKSIAGAIGIYEGLRTEQWNKCGECGLLSCRFRKEQQ
ncbi:MAG: hypothetical protein AAGU74_09215 [Bacillota bacterium]